jgi:hypothetical protein
MARTNETGFLYAQADKAGTRLHQNSSGPGILAIRDESVAATCSVMRCSGPASMSATYSRIGPAAAVATAPGWRKR